jgi:large subunit ribosomal protein L20
MTRVKRGVTQRKRHKKILKAAKGYRGARGNLFREAKRAVMKAGLHAYRHRREKKREIRGLWILRINAAVRTMGMNYSRFINALLQKNVQLDRKVLSHLAMEKPGIFKEVVNFVSDNKRDSRPVKKEAIAKAAKDAGEAEDEAPAATVEAAA